MPSQDPALVWFRNDLRLTDHPALTAAARGGGSVVPVFVRDDEGAGVWPSGGASRWWLHHSLSALGASLERLGARLVIARGATADELARIARAVGAKSVHFTRAYEPAAIALEGLVKARLEADGVEVKRYAGAVLFEPDAIRTKTGVPYRVYTPYWRTVSGGSPPREPLPVPETLATATSKVKSLRIADLDLLPTKPDWSGGMAATWQPGEAAARARLEEFLVSAISDYAENRNRPDLPGTSRLSPHLHFGEISPAQCWRAAMLRVPAAKTAANRASLETFAKELVWREFSYHLLFNFPTLPEKPFNPAFARFPWVSNDAHLHAWQRGRTGYPIVDAGMRQLWETGWMHNRVRMIVGSFLVKNLLIPWQEGAAWFWDTLVDADLASNSASWQWIAGCGADAAPYFRIFNAVTQGEKFDPDGAYVRRFVPELADLPTAHIHAPWLAPRMLLTAAGIELGENYPLPIVDHAETRVRALQAYEQVKAARREQAA